VQDIFADSDPSPNFRVAKAICMLQTLYGVIPKIYGKGKNAKVGTVRAAETCHFGWMDQKFLSLSYCSMASELLTMRCSKCIFPIRRYSFFKW